MNGKIDDPPAFPGPTTDGMTLRDYFAANAMQGWMASRVHVKFGSVKGNEDHISGVAELAYDIADAMLKARGN